MIRCRTAIDNNMIKALTNYHTTTKKTGNVKQIALFILGIIFLIFSIINAYGLWQKYYGSESILLIIMRASIFIILSLFIIYSGFKGSTHKLYRELQQYFKKSGAKYIDYIIDNNGIKMKINDSVTLYEWNVIDHIESDDNFYYFSSNGKHSIIDKNPISPENISLLENLIGEIAKNQPELFTDTR